MEETFYVRSVLRLIVKLWLSQLRVTVTRSEKLVAEARDSSGTQRKEDVHLWQPLPSNGK
jgi:hypothetical protein